MSKKAEMKFLTGLKKDFKRHKLHFYKIPDTPTSIRFQMAKPFDCYIGKRGESGKLETGGMEAKFLDASKGKSVNFKDLRETQHKGLSDMIDDGGQAWVFYQIKFGREMRLYFWEYRDFVRLCEKYGNSRSKIIPLSEVEGMSHIVGKKNRFDVLEYDLSLFERAWEMIGEIYGE